MKVLQVHNYYKTRGGECSVVNAERALLESHGHEVMTYYRDSREIDGLGMLDKVHMDLFFDMSLKLLSKIDNRPGRLYTFVAKKSILT